jgi:hypothetical protein
MAGNKRLQTVASNEYATWYREKVRQHVTIARQGAPYCDGWHFKSVRGGYR